MARKKVKLAYITNQRTRKSTFNKRKGGFIKKIDELSVLCGVEACAIIYNPFNTNQEVWPSNSGVENVLSKFEMLTEMEQEKRTVNHESFLKQSISKTMESNNKKMKDNSEKTMKEAMFHFLRGEGDKLELTDENREDLCKYIDEYLKQLFHHRNVILNQQSNLEYGESSSVTDVATVIAPTTIAKEGSSSFPNTNARPIISSNHISEQDTNQNEQEGWLIDQMMNNSKQMSCLTLDDNNRYHQQQS